MPLRFNVSSSNYCYRQFSIDVVGVESHGVLLGTCKLSILTIIFNITLSFFIRRGWVS